MNWGSLPIAHRLWFEVREVLEEKKRAAPSPGACPIQQKVFTESEMEKLFTSRLAAKELEWSMKRKQSQTEDVMEKIQMKVMFQDLQKKSAQIEVLKTRLENGRVREQAQIEGLQSDLDKTETELVKVGGRIGRGERAGEQPDEAMWRECSEVDE
jgi:hypothetical protein